MSECVWQGAYRPLLPSRLYPRHTSQPHQVTTFPSYPHSPDLPHKVGWRANDELDDFGWISALGQSFQCKRKGWTRNSLSSGVLNTLKTDIQKIITYYNYYNGTLL